MLYTYFALLFGFIWFIADKELKDSFNKYLKYSSAFFILLMIAIDLFMFVETERYLHANEYNDSGLVFSNILSSCPINMSIVVGTNISGNLFSLCYDDKNASEFRFTGGGINADYRVNYSAKNPKYVNIKYKSNDSDNDTVLQYDSGVGWVSITTLPSTTNNETYTTLSVAALQNVNSSSYNRLRIYDISPPASNGMFSIEYITLSDNIETYLYSQTSIDTATVAAYHYSEYAFMETLTDMLPYVAMLVGVLLGIQYLYLMYIDSVYGRKPPKSSI